MEWYIKNKKAKDVAIKMWRKMNAHRDGGCFKFNPEKYFLGGNANERSFGGLLGDRKSFLQSLSRMPSGANSFVEAETKFWLNRSAIRANVR